jgi:hypothetical protein
MAVRYLEYELKYQHVLVRNQRHKLGPIVVPYVRSIEEGIF